MFDNGKLQIWDFRYHEQPFMKIVAHTKTVRKHTVEQQHRHVPLQLGSLDSAGMRTIEGDTGTIAASGTTLHTATTVFFPCATSDFTGIVAGNRHYSTGTIEGPLLLYRNTAVSW